MNVLTVPRSFFVPALIAVGGAKTADRLFEFFTAHILPARFSTYWRADDADL